MKFKSISDKAISFEVGGAKKDVAPGGECVIPDSFAWVVKSRGLPLVAIPGTEDTPPQKAVDLVPALNKARELLTDANATIEEQAAVIQSLREEAESLRLELAELGKAKERVESDLAAATNRVRDLERDVERLTAPVQTTLDTKSDKSKVDPKSK